MADVSVNFMHPTDGRVISVTVDNTITCQEAIGELIVNDFIPNTPEGYSLAIMGGRLEYNKSFVEWGIKDNDTIRIIPCLE